MVEQSEYHNVMAWLDGCRRPLLLSHRRADGDALGALAGMSLALRHRGLEPRVVLFERFPARYALIQDSAIWEDWEGSSRKLEAQCDAVVILDTCSVSQLEPVMEFLGRAPRTLVLDHHATYDPIGTRPGDLRLFDQSASATCLMVAEWAAVAGVPVEPRLATVLFVGIATDCGWFRFANTDARTLRVAAELLAAGAAADRIHAAIYQQDRPERLKLVGRLLESLELHADGQLAVMYLRPADFAAAGADRDCTEDLINEAGRLGCTEATILFTEEAGCIRVNLRSKLRLDVAALASRFGGGGHARAAGARLDGAWDKVVPEVIATAVAALRT